MSRDVFDAELGYAISAENGDRQVYILSGTAVPDGTSGKQSEAPIGSLYVRSGTGELYQKIANAGAPADYEINGAGVTLDQLSWRNEKVRFATNDTLTAGTFDITTLTDNDDMVIGDINVGEYAIGDLDGVPALFEITAKPAGNTITIAAAGQAIANNDTFMVQQYLPDVSGQENLAIVHIPTAGSAGIKIADVDWSIATGIVLSGGYAAASGDVTAGDTVEAAIQKLDGVNDAQDSVLGVTQGDTNLGTFTGDIISDNGSVKAGMQELETELVDTRDNVDDLITLSGVAENSTNLGAFTAPADFLLTATETIKSALQKVADYLFGIKVTQTTGVQASTVVDSVAHATYKRVQWIVEVFETATPANREGFVIDALTDGTSVDDSKYAKLKLGGGIGAAAVVAINGANMELSVSATPSCTVNVRRITVI